jgi:hypothetical protein
MNTRSVRRFADVLLIGTKGIQLEHSAALSGKSEMSSDRSLGRDIIRA